MNCDWKLLIFDLDGLLVNTEMMHWRAYEKACQEFGTSLGWNFDDYFQIASTSSHGIQERLVREHPELFNDLSWDAFYERKHQALLTLLDNEPIPLMPGVVELLERAHAKGLKMACVTHSRMSFVDTVRKQHQCLGYIQSWYTRESYDRPKPAPDGYVKAIETAGILPEQAIGFEDSLRGLQSLMDAGTTSVLVTKDRFARESVKSFPKVIVFSRIDEALSYGPFSTLFQFDKWY